VKFGVVLFPGSNCDADAIHVVKHVLGQPTVELWHKDRDLQQCEVVVLAPETNLRDGQSVRLPRDLERK
jgi:phosphoribosylformylglycinamidine (FGAM) synthase-like amidotransferase family enzyme